LETLRPVRRYFGFSLIFLAYIAFIGLGMRDGLMGVAWPSMRTDFSKPLESLAILLIAGVAGYMTSSFLIGTLMARFGAGNLLVVSFALSIIALVGYTLVPAWWMLILLGMISGLGSGAIDAGLNTYVAAHFGEGPMQWLHASYGIGITLGPLIMTAALTALHSWRMGYGAVGVFQIVLMIVIMLTLPKWKQNDRPLKEDQPKRLTDYRTPMLQTLRQPQVWLSALLFFMYVGAEVSLGTWTYSLLVESRGINPTAAGLWSGSYWGTFTISRILAGLYTRRLSTNRLVQGSLAGALLGAILLAWNPSPLANLLAVGLIGFSIAPVFPALISGTSQRVGAEFAANTIGMQMTASGLGTAVIPSLLGVLARWFSLEVIPICLLVVFVGMFGIYRISMNTHKTYLEKAV
jgi:fucose permease